MELVRGCPHCGLFNELPPLQAEGDLLCPRCGYKLVCKHKLSIDHVLAYAIAGFMFCLVLATSPFMDVILYGRHQTSTLWLGPQILDQEQLMPVAIVVLFMTLLLPTLKFALMIAVLAGLKWKSPSPLIGPMFRWIAYISPWAMLEVYLLGFLVAYTRLEAMTYIKIDIAAYALVGAMICMAAVDTLLDKEKIWAAIGEKRIVGDDQKQSSGGRLLACHLCHQVSATPESGNCPRCDSTIHYRKRESVSRTWALMIAAAIFYIPANIFPVMQITSFGKNTPYTIAGGMLELNAHGLWPLAIVVFIASIAIPFLKIVALVHLLVTTREGSQEQLHTRTKIYRIIHFIGRWSMVDIFMISILVALMRFGQFAQIEAKEGAIFFAAVVILTIIAVDSFDIRLMWDNAKQNKTMKLEPQYG